MMDLRKANEEGVVVEVAGEDDSGMSESACGTKELNRLEMNFSFLCFKNKIIEQRRLRQNFRPLFRW